MGNFSAFFMQTDVMEIRSLEPLCTYLRSGNPLTDDLVNWLSALSSPKGYEGMRIVFKATRGSPGRTNSEFQKDLDAYDYYEDLCNKPTTRRLADQYARALKTGPAKFFSSQKKIADGFYKADRTTYVIQRKNKPDIKLVKGKPLPDFVALALAAVKRGRAPDTLRKTFAQIRNAKAIR